MLYRSKIARVRCPEISIAIRSWMPGSNGAWAEAMWNFAVHAAKPTGLIPRLVEAQDSLAVPVEHELAIRIGIQAFVDLINLTADTFDLCFHLYLAVFRALRNGS
jgi:hypothetical protein